MKVGPDISHHQASVDLARAKPDIDFIILKATEGTTFLDDTFGARWDKATALGIPRIAYHFAHPENSAAAEADWFISKVRAAGTSGRWAVALDFERATSRSASQLVSWATAWIERVRGALNRPVLFYTYPNYWSAVMGSPSAIPSHAVGWWARYASAPDAPSSWGNPPPVWQCSDGTHGLVTSVPGIGAVDYNRMTDAAFGTIFGGSVASIDQVIAMADSQVGTNENPPGSNHVPYTDWYGIGNVPWCAIFMSWVFTKAGNPLPPIETAKGFHYTPNGVRYFKDHNAWTTTPKRGHLVFYDFPDSITRVQHVGIVTRVNSDGTIDTIEGNTSQTSQDNGGEVQRRHRTTSSVVGYGIPRYGTTTQEGFMSIFTSEDDFRAAVASEVTKVIRQATRGDAELPAFGYFGPLAGNVAAVKTAVTAQADDETKILAAIAASKADPAVLATAIATKLKESGVITADVDEAAIAGPVSEAVTAALKQVTFTATSQ